MIIDCFPFYNELDLLEIRLEELKEVVDWFVLVEANATYSGIPKAFTYEANQARFEAYNICHIKIHSFVPYGITWHREQHMRNTLSVGLEKLEAQPEDIILLSDVDEIPRAHRVQEYAEAIAQGEKSCCVFEQALYYYYVNCRVEKKWHGTRMIRHADLTSFHALRTMIGHVIPDGGWHFRYVGGVSKIQEQIAASVHLERNTPATHNPTHITQCIREQKDLFGEDIQMHVEPMDDRLPRYLLTNQSRFHHLIRQDMLLANRGSGRAVKPVFPEAGLHPHRLDVNPEARLFSANTSAATEEEYLGLLAAMVGIFKPTHLFETGTWNGDGALALLRAAGPGAEVWTFNDSPLPPEVVQQLQEEANATGNGFHFLQCHTQALMEHQSPIRWRDITQGKATFAFLDASIAHRAPEFAYISDPENGVLDFERPLCVCIHDMSRYRHPHAADTQFLAQTVRYIQYICEERGWQILRLHQSRGLFVLTKYPEVPGIDGWCIVPEELLSEQDIRVHFDGDDPYLITDYYPQLAHLVQRKRPRTVLEIGIRYGYSLGVMLDASPSIEQVFGFDADQSPSWGGVHGDYSIGQRNLTALWRQGRWPQLQTLHFFDRNTQKIDSLPLLLRSIDLASVDGDHSPEGCLHDFDLVLPYVSPGGIIIGDGGEWHNLYPFIAEWARRHGFRCEMILDSSRRGRVVVSLPPYGVEVAG